MNTPRQAAMNFDETVGPSSGAMRSLSAHILEQPSEKVVGDLGGAARDKALALLATPLPDFDPNSAEAKRVLRKIDTRIVPLLLLTYAFMLVDKNSLSFAYIMGLAEDTHVTDSQYSWLGSIVYFGILAGEVPAAFAMQRVPLAKFFSLMVIIWGLILACQAACNSFGSLFATRFLLGFIEACAVPCMIYILGSFYTKEEQISRVGLWYTSTGLGTVLSGFFAWIIWHANWWPALFIFEGCLTMGLGVALWFVLAGSPTDASWLSEDEKRIALERLRGNQTGTEVWRFNHTQLFEAFRDPRLYLVFLILVSTGLPNGGISVFGPAIIAQFGFTLQQTTLLSMAPGGAIIAGTLVSLLIARYSSRTVGGAFALTLSCIGVVMMLTIDPAHYTARYGGYVLMMLFPIVVMFTITFMTAGVGGSTKKLAFGAVYQVGYTLGNILGPQTYRQSDAPDYYTAKYTMLAFLVFCLILFVALGTLQWYWNIRRDRQLKLNPTSRPEEATTNKEFLDLTDFQMKSLRYPV